MTESATNVDRKTIKSFGAEWERYDQSELLDDEREVMFRTYFDIFPWDLVGPQSEGFDMGCGSGRWARGVAPRVGRLNCIDPSEQALAVSRKNLSDLANVSFHEASADTTSLGLASQDFGYSLGVLHHIPDTAAALKSCTKLLRPGAPFLLYIYYRFDNRPIWFSLVWQASETLRAIVMRLPTPLKPIVTDTLAGLIYWPLARTARIIERLGYDPSAIPLSYYRDKSFYTMRTDSRDRFGTPLEQRFTRLEIHQMMADAGLRDIRFSESEPYWVACGIKA